MRRAGTLGTLALIVAIASCESQTVGEEAAPAAPSPAEASAPAAADAEILATANGLHVTADEFQQAAQRGLRLRGGELSLEERRELLDRLVDQKLLYLAALDQGMDKDPQVQRFLARLVFQQNIATQVPKEFDAEELMAYYQEHLDEFVIPEGVQIRRLLIQVNDDRSEEAAKALADELRTQIAAEPESFEELAAEHSEDSNLPGGRVSYFLTRTARPWLDVTVVEKAFELEVGAISPVFRSREGYNIIQLVELRERTQRDFEAARPLATRKLRNEVQREIYDSYLAGLRQKASIRVDEDKLAALEVKPPAAARSPHGSAPPEAAAGEGDG